MAKTVTTVSEEGFASTSNPAGYDMDIDPTGESAPDTLDALLAAYGACYVPALRVGAEQRDAGDLGRVEIETTGELNDDDKLAAIRFDVRIEAAMDDETAERVVERAHELCKVGDALKADLRADVHVHAGAV
jgi:uncharacterized OsmC-like protein